MVGKTLREPKFIRRLKCALAPSAALPASWPRALGRISAMSFDLPMRGHWRPAFKARVARQRYFWPVPDQGCLRGRHEAAT